MPIRVAEGAKCAFKPDLCPGCKGYIEKDMYGHTRCYFTQRQDGNVTYWAFRYIDNDKPHEATCDCYRNRDVQHTDD